jgi:hypothetical protein
MFLHSIAPEEPEEHRSFFTTPFDEYTVMESYALLFLILGVCAVIYHMFRRFF